MSNFTEPDYLKNVQYGDAHNLSVRIRLHELFSTNPYDYYLWAFDNLAAETPRASRLLEVGCGRCDLWSKNAGRIPPDWTITLSDFSPGMLEDGYRHLGDLAGRFDWRSLDVQNIPFEDETFDVVIAHNMLYHVPDLAGAIAEIRRVLRPDGTLLASTMGAAHMQELHEIVRELVPDDQFSPEASPFTLETGDEQLAASFGSIRRKRYDCDLAVTEAEPLVEYVMSIYGTAENNTETRRTVDDFIRRQLALRGVIHITKDVGIFIAQGYAGA